MQVAPVGKRLAAVAALHSTTSHPKPVSHYHEHGCYTSLAMDYGFGPRSTQHTTIGTAVVISIDTQQI